MSACNPSPSKGQRVEKQAHRPHLMLVPWSAISPSKRKAVVRAQKFLRAAPRASDRPGLTIT